MIDGLRCLLYRRLDWFRRTAFATRFVYHGVPVRIGTAVTVEGRVTRVVGAETDGDVTFNITLDDGTCRHCEVTPCAPDAIRRLALGLAVNARVRVSGTDRFDPKHVGDGGHVTSKGWQEVHPVTGIEVLNG